MADLKSIKLIYLKAVLFLGILIISSLIILLEEQRLIIALALLMVIWSSARLYYFMFYVIERYVDPDFKFSGIYSFFCYLMKRGK